MLIIAKEAEKELVNDLQDGWLQQQYQLGFSLSLSEFSEVGKAVHNAFLERFREEEISRGSRIYICKDHDILFFTPYWRQSMIKTFLARLAEAIGVVAEQLESYLSIYDIRQQWPDVEQLIIDKQKHIISNAPAFVTKTQEPEPANGTLAGIVQDLNEALIATLQQRRDARTKPVVMVVDDDQFTRTMTQTILNKKYHVEVAANAAQTFPAYIEKAPDVLFLDIGLPDADGYEILEWLFFIDPKAYVIMFSGRREKASVMKALELGAMGYVGKPFKPADLLNYAERSPFIGAKMTVVA